MAVVTSNVALDMENRDFFYGAVTTASSSEITLTAGSLSGTYGGNFTYDDYGRVYGQVFSYETKENGSQLSLVSGLSLDAYQVSLLTQSSSATGLYEYALAGNDRVYGSQFNDRVFGFDGDDQVFGEAGNDILYGDAGRDTLDGGDGRDFLVGGQSDDLIRGGGDFDTAAFVGAKSNYTVNISADGTVRVNDRTSNRDGLDTLVDVENLLFQDQQWELAAFNNVVELSEEEFATFAEMYIAYFNRAPDSEGLLFWANALSNGTSIEEIAGLFFDQPETRNTYPDSDGTENFVSTVYENVLGRQIDPLGAEFWIEVLENGSVSRPQFMLEIIRGAKSEPEIGASPDFVAQKLADVEYLNNKADIGIYYSAIAGLSNVDNASATMQLFDGSSTSVLNAKAAIDSFAAESIDAVNGEFVLSLVGVVANPFDTI